MSLLIFHTTQRTTPDRQTASTPLCLTSRRLAFALTGLLFVAGCTVTRVPPTDQPIAGCPVPTATATNKKDLEVANTNIGNFAIGGLKYEDDPKVVEVLSDYARDNLMVDYLVCVAEKRRHVTTQEQIDYLRSKLIYVQRSPTPAELRQWDQEHPFPREDTSGTATPAPTAPIAGAQPIGGVENPAEPSQPPSPQYATVSGDTTGVIGQIVLYSRQGRENVYENVYLDVLRAWIAPPETLLSCKVRVPDQFRDTLMLAGSQTGGELPLRPDGVATVTATENGAQTVFHVTLTRITSADYPYTCEFSVARVPVPA